MNDQQARELIYGLLSGRAEWYAESDYFAAQDDDERAVLQCAAREIARELSDKSEQAGTRNDEVTR